MIEILVQKYPSGLYCTKLGSETICFQQKVDVDTFLFSIIRSSPKMNGI